MDLPAPQRPRTVLEAAAALAVPGATPSGDGVDLGECMREGIVRPASLVDVRALPQASDVIATAAGGLRIGGACRVADLATHPLLRERVPALAAACAAVVRVAGARAGTLAGNVCQRPRCQYFRAAVPCRKNGGDGCPAVDGDNRRHAILGGGPCWIVHPSDAAVALVALEATFEIASVAGTRLVAASDFFVLPAARLDHETVLQAGEWIVAIDVPAVALGGVQRYDTWGDDEPWPPVTLAAIRRADGEVRLVLGGVAPVPWRVYGSIEEDVKAGNLDPADIETLADRALYDAAPLALNGYKVDAAAMQLRQAMQHLSDAS